MTMHAKIASIFGFNLWKTLPIAIPFIWRHCEKLLGCLQRPPPFLCFRHRLAGWRGTFPHQPQSTPLYSTVTYCNLLRDLQRPARGRLVVGGVKWLNATASICHAFKRKCLEGVQELAQQTYRSLHEGPELSRVVQVQYPLSVKIPHVKRTSWLARAMPCCSTTSAAQQHQE